MEKTEKFRMRRYSKKAATNIYAAHVRGVYKHRCINQVNFIFHKVKFTKWESEICLNRQ